MKNSIVAGALALALAGCSATVQTSSGRGYLKGYDQASAAAGLGTQEEFLAAANVEPLLTLPGRFGIARVENGRLTSIPDDEMAAWAGLAERTEGKYGEFVPVNLLVAELSTPRSGGEGLNRTQSILRTIRLGAARQHMDAVLIYEVYGTSDSRQSPLSVGDLTILGAFLLPGRQVEAVGHAEALLFDVRNGYPYLTASETVDKDSLATSARSYGRGLQLKDQAMAQAVTDLTASLEPAFKQLADELAGPGN